jgi:hypothetical protein
MHSIDIQLRRGELRAAAALPQLIDGAALRPPEYRLKQRPNGVWAIFEGAKYVKTTGLRDRPMAEEFLEIFRLQQDARREGIVDARYVQADMIAAYYLEQIPAAAAGVRRNDTRRLRRLRPEIEGKRLCDLTGATVAAIVKRMLERYAPSTGPGLVPGVAHRDPGLLPRSRHAADHAVRRADAAAGLRPRTHGGGAGPDPALGPR